MTDNGEDKIEQRNRSQQVYLLGDQQVRLPPEVTIADWALERLRVQNPRIRSLLGCVKSLESVLDSNYAILHCSPQRLHEIWRRVRHISDLIRRELAPLLREPSCVPALEAERRNTLMALELLESTVLRDLDLFPIQLESGQITRVRKLLCVSMGKLHAFLQDGFSRIVAADPRSRFDADYFLSRRFPHDVEEAEWLWASVEELKGYLGKLQDDRKIHLAMAAETLRQESTLPTDDEWSGVLRFLDRLRTELTPRLREVLSLRGIRFDEMEVLDRYALELPTLCRLIAEIGTHFRGLSHAMQSLPASSPEARAFAVEGRRLLRDRTNGKLSELLVALDERLRDLEAFVPFWLEEIGRRRALMLRPQMDREAAEFPVDESPEEQAGDRDT